MGWIDRQVSTMEIDRGLNMFRILKAPRGFLHPLDRRIDATQASIGAPMLPRGEHVDEVPVGQLFHLRHRSQPVLGGPPEPAGEELLGCARLGVVPDLAKALLDPPGLVPPDAQQPRRPFHRTLPKHING